jgi:multidrug efflux system membrane fusion protein
MMLAALVIAAIGGSLLWQGPAAQAERPSPTPPAVPVTFVTIHSQPVRLWSEFSGRLTPVDAAEIRPEVSGRITEIRFVDGQNVKKGDVLVVIDPRPYEAALAKTDANLAAARNNATLAQKELKRAVGLMKSQTIPQRQLDERVNAESIAQAAVTIADAERRQAKLNLDYAYIKAPFDGRVGRTEITVGNLVQSNQGPPILTTIVAQNSIYADFEVDEQTFIRQIRNQAKGKDQEQKIPVELHLRDVADSFATGTIHAFDNRINTQSGTIRARAKFDNPGGQLIPGMFVIVKMASSAEQNNILVPERAVGTDQNRKFVYVIDKDNKVQYRPVTLGANVGDKRIVASGLVDGDRVIVEGIQHVRPDVIVAPTEQAI